MREPRHDIDIRDFSGLVLDMDPYDRPEGMAVEQVNATSIDRGELQNRGGYRVTSFEDRSTC